MITYDLNTLLSVTHNKSFSPALYLNRRFPAALYSCFKKFGFFDCKVYRSNLLEVNYVHFLDDYFGLFFFHNILFRYDDEHHIFVYVYCGSKILRCDVTKRFKSDLVSFCKRLLIHLRIGTIDLIDRQTSLPF